MLLIGDNVGKERRESQTLTLFYYLKRNQLVSSSFYGLICVL